MSAHESPIAERLDALDERRRELSEELIDISLNMETRTSTNPHGVLDHRRWLLAELEDVCQERETLLESLPVDDAV